MNPVLVNSSKKMIVKLITFLIKTYQTVFSPLFGNSCKYTPTCSQYMIDAVNSKGILKGVVCGLWRVIRCNPFSEARYDPVRGVCKH